MIFLIFTPKTFASKYWIGPSSKARITSVQIPTARGLV
jgi:hypothetical protein